MIPLLIFTGGVAFMAFLRWRKPADNRLIKRKQDI